MRVNDSAIPQNTLNSGKTSDILKKNSRRLEKIIEQLSTARRINRASDDAAGLAISEQLTANIRSFIAASRNVQDAVAALNIAEGAANEISDMLQRQRELAIAARNSTLTDEDRKAMDKEYQALTKEIERIANSTNYNRQKTSNGTGLGSGSAIVQAGPEADDQITLPRIDFTATSSGITGTSIANAADAKNAFIAVDSALKSLQEKRTALGAMINRFESTVNNLSAALINTQAAESVLRDQDMAEGIAELTRQQLLHEGGMKAFDRFIEISRNQIMGILG